MASIKRIYVEKKPGFDIEASHLLWDVRTNLGLEELTGLRVLNRYDMEGISDADYAAAVNTIFSEPPVDVIFEETLPLGPDETAFAVEYLPGQYDQRADSAMQCIQLISRTQRPTVLVAKVMVLKGSLSPDAVERIKSYCINPVDSREAALEKPETLQMEMETPPDVAVVAGFTAKSREEMEAYRQEMGAAMSLEDLLFCQVYFRDTEHRDPTVTELKVIDTYWSDHCRHTTFQTGILAVDFEEGAYAPAFRAAYDAYLNERKAVYGEQASERDITLMDMAVLGMKTLRKQGVLDNLDQSEEINACSIVVPVRIDGKTEDWLIMFKNETHNHPTEIEPFGGAATCLGGAIRDPLSGRAYVYQAMRVTGSGDPRTKVADTIAGKLPQRKITTEAARGYSSYGNQIGLATGQVAEVYDEGFVAKRMEIGAVVGAVKKDQVRRERPAPGDVVILTGGRTGRDGCGGATGSSKEHTVESIAVCGAEVQKGNPPTERKLQRLFRNPAVSRMIKRCNDFGAGGVSVAIGELADGLSINLDAVPKKYEGLDGTELAISESQERMAVVVAKEDAASFIQYAAEENLEATPVAVVTEKRRLVMDWRQKNIVNLSRDFLDTNGAKQTTEVKVSMPEHKDIFETPAVPAREIKENLEAAWLKNLADLNVAGQRGLCERFDSTIGAATVLMPFGGKRQLTPAQVMAAKVPVLEGETTTATIMSYGYHPQLANWSPFHSALYAVVASVSKIVAAGGDYKRIRLTFQEYFEKLGTDPKKWGKPFSALLGAFQAQMALGIAAIGGKDSMSGTFEDIHVPPTLVSFAITTAEVEQILSPEFKEAGHPVLYLPLKRDSYGLPDFEAYKAMLETVQALIAAGDCVAAYTVGSGGIAEAVSKMAFGNGIGIQFAEVAPESLFVPAYGGFVLELTRNTGVEGVLLGETTKEAAICLGDMRLPLDKAVAAWDETLEDIFPTGPKSVAEGKPVLPPYIVTGRKTSGQGIVRPRVLIPTFPGTNCEVDSARAFEKAGAVAETVIIANNSVSSLEASIDKLVKTIETSQMIMLPGGFSAGDEPDGSGKFIAAVFRNPRVQDAVMDLLKQRDGLMLGICNGFQALVKLGLLPYGEIRDMEADSPTLTFNTVGRHVSRLVDTRIVSNRSPWLWETEVGAIHTIPVSHGEGRFVAPEGVLDSLVKNGQIATQYVDPAGEATYENPYNPNGSMLAIEGISSPDGRVFGKMGHSERVGYGLYCNVPGEKEQGIFVSGVKYFR